MMTTLDQLIEEESEHGDLADRIALLEVAAAIAGDDAMIELCNRAVEDTGAGGWALTDDEESIRACIGAMRDARAQEDRP